MSEDKEIKKDGSEEMPLKKLISKEGIFLIYNFNRYKGTLPFIGSIVITLFYILFSLICEINQEEVLKYLVDKFLSIFPNLLGFSLGGYAIIIGFGNSDFISRIAMHSKKKMSFSIYEILNSVFAFNLLCQFFVLIFSIGIDFSFFIHSKSGIEIPFCLVNFINLIVTLILVFMSSWTLLVIPYLVTNRVYI